jgi:AraC-like DNA-binding protein
VDIKDFAKLDTPELNRIVAKELQNFPIYVQRNKWQSQTAYHFQPGVEIHITQEGAGALVVDKRVLLQSPRQVVIFRGSVPHQLIANSSYKRTVICLDLERVFLGGEWRVSFHDFSWVPENHYCMFFLEPMQFLQLERLCDMLSDELKTKASGWESMALSLALKVTVLLRRSFEGEGKASVQQPEGPRKISELVQKCSDYVCTHLGEDLSLKTVAKMFAVSEEYLTRCFKKEMGMSFYQYVLMQRVAAGKRLLREASNASITSIAYALGFPSSSHFCRTFKSFTDETPTAYRHRMSGA